MNATSTTDADTNAERAEIPQYRGRHQVRLAQPRIMPPRLPTVEACAATAESTL